MHEEGILPHLGILSLTRQTSVLLAQVVTEFGTVHLHDTPYLSHASFQQRVLCTKYPVSTCGILVIIRGNGTGPVATYQSLLASFSLSTAPLLFTRLRITVVIAAASAKMQRGNFVDHSAIGHGERGPQGGEFRSRSGQFPPYDLFVACIFSLLCRLLALSTPVLEGFCASRLPSISSFLCLVLLICLILSCVIIHISAARSIAMTNGDVGYPYESDKCEERTARYLKRIHKGAKRKERAFLRG